ncbi:hypothetical protein [Pseudoalteromonas rubra]|uniref:hypothetical protein n=1 Tax=Pseudoalteromonas rubra TaxID=43658 RepID=UPI0013DD8ADD|nr:hypothetical protein [Pseudoalteromonas rubra]
MSSTIFEKDLILVCLSVLLSVFFGRNIINGISERVISLVKTLFWLEFRSVLRSLHDGREFLSESGYRSPQDRIRNSEMLLEKSIRCNISVFIWIVFSFLSITLLKSNGLITEDYFSLFKIIAFVVFYLYSSYFIWNKVDNSMEKFFIDKENANTKSKHRLLTFYSCFSIPIIAENHQNWLSKNEPLNIGLWLLLIGVVMFIGTRVHRALSVNRYECGTGPLKSKKYYLAGVNIETLVYFLVFSFLIILMVYFKIPESEFSKHDFFYFSLIFVLFPLFFLLYRIIKIVKLSCIVNYFFNLRISNTRE